MKKIVLAVGVLMFMYVGIAFADEGAGQSGPSVAIGYDGVYLNYKEYVSGRVVDQDTGWQNGGFAEVRYDDHYVFVRANFDGVGSNNAKYTGQLQNGTPISLTTRERIYIGELDAGVKALNISTSTLSPYLGIGDREWDRGQDVLPDYKEKYTWWFGAAGVNYAYKINKWTIGIDGALLWPFDLKMETDTAGLTDNATFKIQSRLGYRVELPINYEVYSSKAMKMFVFGTPHYEGWNIGQSPTITLTSGGVPVAMAFEPKSITNIYSIRVGVGFNF